MSPIPSFDPLGLPAPTWLLFGLKVFGFWLHMVFMNLWLVGLPAGLLLSRGEGATALAGRRLVAAMPVILALGINAGIVPLLFLQVLYPQFFYTSTILQAWPWLAMVALLIPAYYGLYVYVLRTKAGSRRRWVDVVGWMSALVLAAIGLAFSSEMQLLTRPDRWVALAEPVVGGAVAGTHLALDGTSFARYLLTAGLALGTTAAWLAVDSAFRWRPGTGTARDEGPAGVRKAVFLLVLAGLAVFGAGAARYLDVAAPFLAGSPELRTFAAAGPVLAVLAGAAFLLRPGRAAAAALVAVQLFSLLGNAVARQVVQWREIGVHFDLGSVPLDLQLSPILLFLATLAVGGVAMAWLVGTYLRAAAAPRPG